MDTCLARFSPGHETWIIYAHISVLSRVDNGKLAIGQAPYGALPSGHENPCFSRLPFREWNDSNMNCEEGEALNAWTREIGRLCDRAILAGGFRH